MCFCVESHPSDSLRIFTLVLRKRAQATFLCRSGYPTVFGTAPTKDSSGAELLCFQLDCVRSERTRCNMRAIND